MDVSGMQLVTINGGTQGSWQAVGQEWEDCACMHLSSLCRCGESSKMRQVNNVSKTKLGGHLSWGQLGDTGLPTYRTRVDSDS